MKKLLSDLLHPVHDHYRSVGELAATVRLMMSTCQPYRDQGRWGESGPHQDLSNYGSCTGGFEHGWHTGRLHVGPGCRQLPVASWQEHHDNLCSCIMAALCGNDPSYLRWRKAQGIHLHMPLKIPMAYQNQRDESAAWEKVRALHGVKLPVSSFNEYHPRVNVLCGPELVIDRFGIRLTVDVTDRGEFRSGCFSSWRICSLSRTDPPRWNCRRETFAGFLQRAVDFYLTLKPRKNDK